MTYRTDTSWIELQPPLCSQSSREAFSRYARALRKLQADEQSEDIIEDARDSFIESVSSSGSDRQVLLAAGLVLTDLFIQRWQLRFHRGRVEIRPPVQVRGDRAAEKARIRRQELVKRDAQLRQAAVQKFLRSMERTRIFNGKLTSIYSLMRDGRELANGLRKAREHSSNGWARVLANVVDPYIEFVTSDEARCAFTGLRLMDIWRYFRHTWTNQYTSVPGRTMMFLLRDREAPFHSVIGIGALSSPVMQIRERDMWVGWYPDKFVANIQANPTPVIARRLVEIVDAAIAEIYVDDLFEDGIISARDLSDPREAVIAKLFNEGAEQRRLHYRYVRSRDHKGPRQEPLESGYEHWVTRARTHLFRSKRAVALASYLRARAVLKKAFDGQVTASKLVALASTALGRDTIRTIVKKAKADRVGISVADITVCGAVQPYNAILGGKLVAMIATSPEVVCEYRHRYWNAESEIASSMAGRPIIRDPSLVLLGTTSLYGVGSSQYNRIKIPCERLGGSSEEAIRYKELGQSEAFGTSHYSDETIDALVDLVQQSSNGQRVNSIFGEGVSPKLRKVRQALDLLAFPSDHLLRHHRRRVVYGVSLIHNLREFLLGIESEPQYLVPIESGPEATARIADWWRERWLRNRIASDDVLAEVAKHTLVRPIRHGARVRIPPPSNQRLLFADPTSE
jgi:hypothetical protein